MSVEIDKRHQLAEWRDEYLKISDIDNIALAIR